MRKGHDYGPWKLAIEKLKAKWAAFARGIINAIADEELKIRRDELDKQIENRTR